jgi:hypothetical protein
MARILGLAAVVLTLVVGAAVAAGTGPTGKLIAGSEESALRLHDLPPGYRLGLVGGCGPLDAFGAPGKPGDAQDRYLRWVSEQLPEACSYLYKQAFEVPGSGPAPPRVETEIVDTPSEAAADEGFELISALFESSPGGDQSVITLSTGGVQVRVYRFESFRVNGKTGRPGSILLWHSGKLISSLKVTGLTPRGNDRAALHFAEIQQWRIEHPSPYTEAERDDTEVWLDDPALTLPVYWVGNSYQSADRPPVELEFSYAGNALPPGAKYELDYQVEGGGFRIEGWTRRGWEHFRRSGGGVPDSTDYCLKTTRTRLMGRGAVIFAAKRRSPDGSCSRRSPYHYSAIAYIGQAAIGVNFRACTTCLEVESSSFDSASGMKAVLGALRVRPKPTY